MGLHRPSPLSLARPGLQTTAGSVASATPTAASRALTRLNPTPPARSPRTMSSRSRAPRPRPPQQCRSCATRAWTRATCWACRCERTAGGAGGELAVERSMPLPAAARAGTPSYPKNPQEAPCPHSCAHLLAHEQVPAAPTKEAALANGLTVPPMISYGVGTGAGSAAADGYSVYYLPCRECSLLPPSILPRAAP